MVKLPKHLRKVAKAWSHGKKYDVYTGKEVPFTTKDIIHLRKLNKSMRKRYKK
jgi:hypothetical protein